MKKEALKLAKQLVCIEEEKKKSNRSVIFTKKKWKEILAKKSCS